MLKKKIKCPRCGNSFEVTNPDGLEQLIVACPNPSCSSKLRVTFATGYTVLTQSPVPDNATGYILFRGSKYSLHEGLNVIGREVGVSEADVQLELEIDEHYVSREHFAIEQVSLKKGSSKYVISDLRDGEKIRLKPTFVNGEKLDKVDRIVLKSGDSITIGEVKMTFNTK